MTIHNEQRYNIDNQLCWVPSYMRRHLSAAIASAQNSIYHHLTGPN